MTGADAAESVTVALDEVDDATALDVAGAGLTSVVVSGTVVDAGTDGVDAISLGVTAGDDATSVALNTEVDVTLTVNDGAAAVVNTVNASASTGGVAYNAATSVATISTGSGEDDVDLKYVATATAKAATVSTGEGDDTLSILVDANGQTGVTVTADAGAGNDTVDINNNGTVAVDFTAGAGDDEVTLTDGLGSVATTDVIDGGEGTDKVVLDAGGTGTLDAEDYIILRDVITSFEAIEFNTTAVTADASRMSTYKDIAFDAVAGTLTKVADDQAISGSSNLTLTANGYDAGANTPAIEGDETYAGTLDVTFFGNGTTGTVTANAEAINLAVTASDSNDDGVVDNTAATLEGDVQTATVTLSATLDEDTAATTADDVLETAEVIVDTSTANSLDALESLTVSGNGTATVTNAEGAALATVNASGLASVDVAGDATTGLDYTTTNVSVAETITLGDGVDALSIGAATSSTTTSAGSTYLNMDTITGLNLIDANEDGTVDAGSDTISVFSTQAVNDQALSTFVKTTTEAASLDLALVDLAAGSDDNLVFAFGGDTYIYADVGATADLVDDTDVLIKLTGTVDLDLLVDALG